MSKKETRRAARQAFPKAKTPPPARSAGGRGRSQARGRGRSGASRLLPQPPSIKKAAIWGVVMGALYFLVIQFLWKSTHTTVLANVIVSVVGCFVFGAVIYFTDHFKYKRYLRKKNASSK